MLRRQQGDSHPFPDAVADGDGDAGARGGSPAAGPGAGGPAVVAPPPPEPPDSAEALGVCPTIPEPVIGRSPAAASVTGLDTGLWAAAQEPRSATGSIRGFAVSCTVSPVSWTWTTGDGGVYTRNHPGRPYPAHAVEHVYETKDFYELGLTVRWRRVTRYGADMVSRSKSEPYTVNEIRSVLLG
jgi:hypothetical protein